jgi:hypothetical protein
MTEVGGEAVRRRTAGVSGTIGTGIATGTVTAGTEIGIGIEAEIGTGVGSGMTGAAAAAGTETTRRMGAAAGGLLCFPAHYCICTRPTEWCSLGLIVLVLSQSLQSVRIRIPINVKVGSGFALK